MPDATTQPQSPRSAKKRFRIYYPVFKRFTDIIISFLGLVFLIILFPFIALAIKLDSPGPVVFSQTRIGRHMRPFKMYKFRTMLQNAEDLLDQLPQDSSTPFLQRENDPRVTKVGAFLRRLSLDEFPQFLNILKGEMSFIGPRPFVESEVEQLDREHLRRHSVRPGLTGYAQIHGRNDLSLDGRMDRDLYYIDNITMWLDIKILLKTIWVTYTRKGAY
jgi:lipopolysaccharide/colanic/teichoic acid biosynthesis glycosyltransferase